MVRPEAATEERTVRDRRFQHLFSYRAWLVDLDGTLYHKAPVRLAMATELCLSGWNVIRVLKAFRRWHERLREDAETQGNEPYETQLAKTSQELSVPVELVEHIATRWMVQRPGRWLRLFRRRDLLAAIGAFRRQGGATALVSDYPAREKLQGLQVQHCFDAVVANRETAGYRMKPSPSGFLVAAETLAVEPSECLVIGDRVDTDREAARRAGMAFAWPTLELN